MRYEPMLFDERHEIGLAVDDARVGLDTSAPVRLSMPNQDRGRLAGDRGRRCPVKRQ
jgi:hypothetical protein